MIQIAYSSTARQLMTTEALSSLQKQAVSFNQANGITGLLIYNDGIFFQVIEGEADAVESLFKRIQSDARHHRVRLVFKIPLTFRDFPSWAMRVENISPDVRKQQLAHILNTGRPAPSQLQIQRQKHFQTIDLDNTDSWEEPSNAQKLVKAFSIF